MHGKSPVGLSFDAEQSKRRDRMLKNINNISINWQPCALCLDSQLPSDSSGMFSVIVIAPFSYGHLIPAANVSFVGHLSARIRSLDE